VISTTFSWARSAWISSAITLRTAPVYWKSMPSTTPTGRAVMKLPPVTRRKAPAIGVLGRPCESSASISMRVTPMARLTHSSASASVTRRPLWNFGARPRARISASICGRAPCTSTRRMPMLSSSAMSWISACAAPASSTSPPKAMTKVRPRKAWM
jgi:hypothetical protein